MQVFEAVKIWLAYHKNNSREKTLRTLQDNPLEVPGRIRMRRRVVTVR
jgi:hypothetical protein